MTIWLILVELAILALVVLLFRGIAKKYTPVGFVWWFVGLLGFAVAGFSGANFTRRSSAPRNTVSGKVEDCVAHVLGRGTYTYTFLVNSLGQAPVEIATRLKPPVCWQDYSPGSRADIYRVVYLDDSSRDLKHEAIRIEVLAGSKQDGVGAWTLARSDFGLGSRRESCSFWLAVSRH